MSLDPYKQTPIRFCPHGKALGQACEECDKPLFTSAKLEEIDYGPSWGSIIVLGIIGIALVMAILLLI